MGLTLNNITNYDILNKENIFRRITSLQIFEKYLNRQINPPITIKSPFRKESHPSSCIFGCNEHSIVFHDKTTNLKGNAIDFVIQLKNLNFYEALVQINKDFNLNLIYNKDKYKDVITVDNFITTQKSVLNNRRTLQITTHKDISNKSMFIQSGIDYWNEYYITLDRLKRHNVFSAERVYIENVPFLVYTDNNPIFAYLYYYKKEYYYKIYRPLHPDKSKRFFNDFHGVTKHLLHGLHLLPKEGTQLIITKSAKDCMVLDMLGFHSIAVQSEGTSILHHHIDFYSSKWKQIYLLYDNDYNKEQNWGQIHANRVIEIYPQLKNITIPNSYQCTDISEVIYKFGKQEANYLINNLLI
jgi:hypothetical protein